MRVGIFLSPSEGKVLPSGCTKRWQIQDLSYLNTLFGDTLFYEHRKRVMDRYFSIVMQMLEKSDRELLTDIYGAKTFNAKNEYELNCILSKHVLLPAIERYDGVAFCGLNFSSLSLQAQQFIHDNVFIFSNLFGVIKASDLIPFYKLKQNCKTKYLTLKDVYNPFKTFLESLEWDYIIDLRAGVYTKIFTPKQPHFFFEFYKNDKIVSHYSKLYRGKILQIIASNTMQLDFHQAFDFFQHIHTDTFRFKNSDTKNNMIFLRYDVYE